MEPQRIYRLGDLQLKIMQILWERGEANVFEVQESLDQKSGLAYTTVATMLRKMELRGLVMHRTEGRRYIYRATVTAESVTDSMAGHVLDRLFEGSLAGMVSHLLASREVSTEELRELERVISERKKRRS